MMRTNTEIEYKTLVTRDQFERLLRHFPVFKTVTQTNTYFDTVDRRLKALKMACRIRVSDDSIVATVKHKVDQGVMEYDVDLEEFDSTVFRRDEFRRLFEELGVSEELIVVGSAKTVRSTVDEPLGELCFDQNTYRGVTDYELEFEVNGDPVAGYRRFMEILELENIPYIPSISKMQRATA
ncbi:MAG: CYTH domain-containing protein [Erysipelotrichaceae bacterium]